MVAGAAMGLLGKGVGQTGGSRSRAVFLSFQPDVGNRADFVLTKPSLSGTILITKTKQREFSMKDMVLKAMRTAAKPVRPGDIAKELGVDGKKVSKAIKALKEEGAVVSPKRCYYEPA
jgi:biotin operon repressor